MAAGRRCARDQAPRIGARRVASLVLAVAGLVGAVPAEAQTPPRGVLLAPSVACRSAPSHAASLSEVLRQTGDVWGEGVLVRDSASDAGGEVWVAVRRQSVRGQCWVPGALVMPARGADPLLAMASRILDAPDGHSLADWVAVHNHFLNPAYRDEVAASPILGLRRLEVLMGALRVAQSGRWEREDPLVLAWLESLGDDVEHSPERRGWERWTVSRQALDALYEAHRDDPVGEEILWKTARYGHAPGECGRSLQCLLDVPLRGVARYWLAYPDGAHVGEAVRAAVGQIDVLGGIYDGGVLGTCREARGADPDSWPARAWDLLAWEREGIAGTRELRATLVEVGEEDGAPLLDYLDDLERCAIEVGAGRSPEARGPSDEAPGDVAVATPPDPAVATPPDPAVPAEQVREFAVIASDVVCRGEPSRTVSGYWVARLDHHFATERPDTIVDGEAWVAVPEGGGCWIPRSQTAPAGTDSHVLAIADRFLASGEGRTLDRSLRVYNVLASRHRGHRAVVDASATLTLRRLKVLREVLRTLGPSSSTGALSRGWLIQLEDEVRLWSIGVQWLVRDEAFLRAYEAHRESPEAEDILWEFSTGATPHDCALDFGCTARVVVANKLVRYWTDYPGGRHVARAVEMATARLRNFLATCEAARGAESGSPEAYRWERAYWDPDGAEVARELRTSLAGVAPEDRAPLVELLDALAECAVDSPLDPPTVHSSRIDPCMHFAASSPSRPPSSSPSR